jgi:DNA-binding XRE family transcriptional regulator
MKTTIPIEFPLEFGQKLKNLRVKKGYTRSGFARHCGLYPQTLMKYEDESSEPSLRMALILAWRLGVPLADLIPARPDGLDPDKPIC